MDRATIERMLEAYGSNFERWPVKPDAETRARLTREPDLKRLLDEAAALDRLLGGGPAANAEAERALAERIVAAAIRSPRLAVAAGAGAPVATTAEAKPIASVVAPPRSSDARRGSASVLGSLRGRDARRSLAVLAASLVIGLSLGQAGFADRVVVGFEDLTGVSLSSASQDMASALGAAEAGDEL